MTAMHMLVGAPNVGCQKLLDRPLLDGLSQWQPAEPDPSAMIFVPFPAPTLRAWTVPPCI
jgi:hypothetical protein